MKRYLLPLAGALISILPSCNDLDNIPDTPNTQQYTGNLITCIVPCDESQEVIMTEAPTYKYTVNTTNNLWKISVSNLSVPGFTPLSFTSPEMLATSGYNSFFNFLSDIQAGDAEISNLEAVIARDYSYYTGESTVIGLPIGTLAMTSFDVKDRYKVHAGPKLCYYEGSVVSRYYDKDGAEQSFMSSNTYFSVMIKLATKTADITIHNAKFAQPMPAMSIMTLSGLSVSGDREHGYRITGKNIIPVVGEGLNAVSYPDFVFNEIDFHPTDDLLTTGECEFTVAGRFYGKFTGNVLK